MRLWDLCMLERPKCDVQALSVLVEKDERSSAERRWSPVVSVSKRRPVRRPPEPARGEGDTGKPPHAARSVGGGPPRAEVLSKGQSKSMKQRSKGMLV